MNREIKFRAFVDEEMVLLPLAGLQYFDFEGSYALSFVVDAYKGFWGHEMYESASKSKCANAPIMQFTGLKDKNGIEIYEGDIISNLSSTGKPIKHSIIYDDKEACFKAQQIPFERWMNACRVYQSWIDECEKEVLGNIYENPELLTS